MLNKVTNASLLSSACSVFGLLLCGLALSTSAQAQTLSLGGHSVHFNLTRDGGATSQDEGGGNISPSTLDGTPLPFVYCVDLDHVVYIPGVYTPTGVTTDGTIYGSPVNNAGQVAYLVDHYAANALTDDQQGGLQAAIWHTIYGPNTALVAGGNTTAGQIAAYNTYLSNVGTDPVYNVRWLSPSNANGGRFQGLVTVTDVPEPGAVALFGGIAVSGSVFLKRRRARK